MFGKRISPGRIVSCLLVALVSLNPEGTAQERKTAEQRAAELVRLLSEGNTKVRHAVLRKLSRLGPRAAVAVPVLILGLSDRDPKIRAESARALREIRSQATAAVPSLIIALSDVDNDVRTAAGSALMTTKPDPKRDIPALIASLRAAPERRCMLAASVLGTLGEPAVPALIDLVKDSDPVIRRHAGKALGTVGPAAKAAVPVLIEALRVINRDDREQFAGVLAGIGSVEPLILALRERDPKVRGGAALALEKMGQQAKLAVPALIAVLADTEPPDDPKPPREKSSKEWRRDGEPLPTGYYAAIKAIGAAAVPALLEQLHKADRPSRILALRAIGFLEADAKAAVPPLIVLLNDPALRDAAADALGWIGQDARAAIPTLLEFLKNPDAAVRAPATITIGRIGWERPVLRYSPQTVARSAIVPLTVALKDTDARVRAAAAHALGEIGEESVPALPEIVFLLGDHAAEVRLAALRAFPRIGKVPGAAQARLMELLKDPESRVRQVAAALIHTDELSSRPVITSLLAALEDTDGAVRRAAASKLAEIDTGKVLSDSPNAGPLLRAALADPDPEVRSSAAYAVPFVRRAATFAVPLLIRRLKDTDEAVRVAAAVALGRLGPDAAPAIPAIFNALDDPGDINIDVFSASAQALQAISPDAGGRMKEHLLVLLDNADKSVRDRSGHVLSQLGATVTLRLIQALIDPRTPRLARIEVLSVLAEEYGIGFSNMSDINDEADRPGREFQPVIPMLRALTGDVDPGVRRDARRLLAVIDTRSEPIARTLLEAAGDQEPYFSDLADYERQLRPSAATILLQGLKDPDEEVRTEAVLALAALAEHLPRPDDELEKGEPDPDDAEARAQGINLRNELVDALIPVLKDPDIQVRWAGAWALGVFASGERCVPVLIKMLKDDTTRIPTGARIQLTETSDGGHWNRSDLRADGELLRVAAIQALRGFGDKAAPAVTALMEVLRGGDALSRWFAAEAAGNIGPKARAAVPELTAILRAKDAVSSAPSGAESTVFRFPPYSVAVAAAHGLGGIGPDAAAAVPALVDVLDAPDHALRRAAVEALGKIGAGAAAAVPNIIRMLSDNGASSVADEAAKSLGRIGAPAVPALIAALHDRDATVRCHAMTAIGKIESKAGAAVPDLIQLLSDRDEEVRAAAAKTLERLSKTAQAAAAVPFLTKARNDSDRVVRENAAAALVKIQP